MSDPAVEYGLITDIREITDDPREPIIAMKVRRPGGDQVVVALDMSEAMYVLGRFAELIGAIGIKERLRRDQEAALAEGRGSAVVH